MRLSSFPLIIGATALTAFSSASRVRAQMVGSDPTYTLASGTASYTNFTVRPVTSTEGSVTQTGGIFNVSGDFWLAPGPNGFVTSTYTIDGGTASFGRLRIAGSAVRVTQNGGTVNVDQLFVDDGYFKVDYTLNAGTLTAGRISIRSTSAADRESNLRLNGGTLRTSRIVAGEQRVFIRFNGATLQAEADNVDWINSGTKAYVYGGGAIFDTDGREMGLYLNLQRQPGDIVADGGLTKRGAGTLTLNFSTNSYSGPTTLEGGTLAIDKAAMLGLPTTNLNFSGGVLRILGTEIQDIGAHPLNSTTFNGGLDIADAAHVFTLATPLSGSGALTKSGLGKLVLKGATTLAGPVTISAGTLQLGDGAVNGSISGPIVNNAALIYQTAGNQTYGGVISGNGTLTKSGPGVLTLTNQNTYTGGTFVNQGTLVAGVQSSIAAFPGGSLVTVNPGGTLVAAGYDSLGYFGGAVRVRINAGGTLTTDGLANQHAWLYDLALEGGTVTSPPAGGDFFLAGPVTTHASETTATISSKNLWLRANPDAPTVSSTFFDVASGSTPSGVDLLITSPLKADSASPLVKRGPGLLQLASANTYGSGTQLQAGVLAISHASALGSGGITFTGGTLRYLGVAPDLSARISAVASGQSIRIDTNGQNVTFGSALTGAGGLAKSGAGSLTLLGTNTFSGNVAVTGGTLVLGGSHGPLNGLSVASGAALTSGSGTVNVTGAVTNHGTIRVTGGAVFNAGNATTFVNEGVLDLLTASAASTLPQGFVNGANGVVITRQNLAIKSLNRAGDSCSVTIAGYTGHSYQLEYSSDLTAPFVAIGAPQDGITGTDLVFNATAPGPDGFFRVRLTP